MEAANDKPIVPWMLSFLRPHRGRVAVLAVLLLAEIILGAEATVLREDGRGAPVADTNHLICCAGYGGPDRHSDPTIGAAVNSLARLGASEEGTLRKHMVMPDGSARDSVYFGITDDEWPAVKARLEEALRGSD